jgi:hypothetical protein
MHHRISGFTMALFVIAVVWVFAIGFRGTPLGTPTAMFALLGTVNDIRVGRKALGPKKEKPKEKPKERREPPPLRMR